MFYYGILISNQYITISNKCFKGAFINSEFSKFIDRAGKRCLKIPCTQADINSTTASQEEAFLSEKAQNESIALKFLIPLTEWPYSTKNEGEIEVGESIYYTCTDYVKVRDIV